MIASITFYGCGSSSSSSGVPAGSGTISKVLTAEGLSTLNGNAMAIQSDGRILVVGSREINGDSSFLLARYQSGGSLDSSFGIQGIVFTPIGGKDSANAVVIQPDEKIIVAGSAWNGSNNRIALARYTANGILDRSFGTGGIIVAPGVDGVDDVAYAVTLQADRKIVAAGYSRSADGISSFTLARFTADGQLDPAFGRSGRVTTAVAASPVEDVAYAVRIQTDGRIVVAGRSYDEKYKVTLVRYDETGAVDPSFGVGGIVLTEAGADSSGAFALAFSDSGSIFAGGYANDGEIDTFALLKYTTNGNRDAEYGNNGIVMTDYAGQGAVAYAILLRADGKIMLAGYNDNYELDSETPEGLDFALARYNVNGTPDTSFAEGGKIAFPIGDNVAYANAIGVHQTGSIILSGCLLYTSPSPRDRG